MGIEKNEKDGTIDINIARQYAETETFKKRLGKIILQGFSKSNSDFVVAVTEIEHYLNNQIATTVYKKYRISIRFHL